MSSAVSDSFNDVNSPPGSVLARLLRREFTAVLPWLKSFTHHPILPGGETYTDGSPGANRVILDLDSNYCA
ncbi:hypothetical protein K438DRAFT_1988353 [Mycena galopus ATCC 62051]|nr:hypothetical protein K438DRAFT_1988353 [Mycena galopus ATCC 62051]